MSDKLVGHGITRERLSEQVAKRIQQLILDGTLKPGEQIPPERQLSEQFGISRTVAREAIVLLQERGLVRVITGSGSYVSKVEPEVIKQSIGLYMSGQENSFRDLLEMRQFFEVYVAGLAAERASEEYIDDLEVALQEMRKALPGIQSDKGQLDKFVQSDLKFHKILAESTNNSLLPVFLDSIMDLLFEFSYQASSQSGAPELALMYHEKILERVSSKDVEGARSVMNEHMTSGAKFMHSK
jgi:GntR family transcriptional repressor for pyruvate dehydrogenase complex